VNWKRTLLLSRESKSILSFQQKLVTVLLNFLNFVWRFDFLLFNFSVAFYSGDCVFSLFGSTEWHTNNVPNFGTEL